MAWDGHIIVFHLAGMLYAFEFLSALYIDPKIKGTGIHWKKVTQELSRLPRQSNSRPRVT